LACLHCPLLLAVDVRRPASRHLYPRPPRPLPLPPAAPPPCFRLLRRRHDLPHPLRDRQGPHAYRPCWRGKGTHAEAARHIGREWTRKGQAASTISRSWGCCARSSGAAQSLAEGTRVHFSSGWLSLDRLPRISCSAQTASVRPSSPPVARRRLRLLQLRVPLPSRLHLPPRAPIYSSHCLSLRLLPPQTPSPRSPPPSPSLSERQRPLSHRRSLSPLRTAEYRLSVSRCRLPSGPQRASHSSHFRRWSHPRVRAVPPRPCWCRRSRTRGSHRRPAAPAAVWASECTPAIPPRDCRLRPCIRCSSLAGIHQAVVAVAVAVEACRFEGAVQE